MAKYQGLPERIGRGGFKVLKDGKLLAPTASQKLYNHSPDGFNWGYGGSGPAQLALGLLLDATGNGDLALSHYQQFKWEIIASLKMGEPWTMTTAEIEAWLCKEHYGGPLP